MGEEFKKLYEVSESQKFDLYNNYVYSQREGFERIINIINDMVNELKENGEISDFFEIRARIKAPKSAIRNDDQKALDDVFGMEIISATEDELEKIIDEIFKFMTPIKEKNHNKPNGYKAFHKLLNFKFHDSEKFKNITIPLIEIQFKTMEVAVKSSGGTADHTLYKGHNKEEIQAKYDNGEFNIYTNIPRMWVSRNGKLVMLSPEETLKKMYPFLKVKDAKEKNEGGETR